MSDSSERLREHPEERFRPAVHEIDLGAAAAQIEAEPLGEARKHRQKTLYKQGPMTVALFHFEAGSGLPPHVADGVVTVHVLTGRLRMMAQGEAHDLPAGKMLVMAPGVRHDVQAVEDSRMLLTVCLDGNE